MSLPRPLTRLAVVLTAAGSALAATVVLPATASAHVTVSSADATAGGYGKLTFRVPNESDTASTVALRIQIPEDAAMGSLRAQPVPGWTVTTTSADLAEPLEVHGQEISSYVSVVEFRAAAGGGIGPGQFQEFALSGGPFPEADQLSFPAVQSYSDGSESAWIEPTVAGQEEPERPAPVLSLASAAGTADHSATEEAASEEAGHEGGHADDPGALALFFSILAFLTALAGVVLGVRANRRTVSS
ncbi:nuclear export factor GLE1 [Blastococcus sp. TBT05-19]|uniref:YcnI family copper-binding membrane protein n=1 Tax=Blastococcus sp. TBT05-19 TaxID=2250581 RepID=UPI000DEA9F94|nr:YcnI family protein [Blastococcus sp. TBT05-19]RBY94500.1 nuclear export factor GLE1 [Blastococcus sp. TBT05-19]